MEAQGAQEEEPWNSDRGIRQKQNQDKQKDKALARVPNLPPPLPIHHPQPHSCSLSPYWVISYLPAAANPLPWMSQEHFLKWKITGKQGRQGA